MNKKKGILGVIAIAVLCLATTGCIFYNKLEADEFRDYFSALGYTVSDSETALYESDSYLVATKDDVEYNIEYYEFETETDAKKVYQKFKDSIANYITSDSENNEVTGNYFAKIVGVSDNEYIVISRVKNTLIFIATSIDYQNEIDDILDEIGY